MQFPTQFSRLSLCPSFFLYSIANTNTHGLTIATIYIQINICTQPMLIIRDDLWDISHRERDRGTLFVDNRIIVCSQ